MGPWVLFYIKENNTMVELSIKIAIDGLLSHMSYNDKVDTSDITKILVEVLDTDKIVITDINVTNLETDNEDDFIEFKYKDKLIRVIKVSKEHNNYLNDRDKPIMFRFIHEELKPLSDKVQKAIKINKFMKRIFIAIDVALIISSTILIFKILTIPSIRDISNRVIVIILATIIYGTCRKWW